MPAAFFLPRPGRRPSPVRPDDHSLQQIGYSVAPRCRTFAMRPMLTYKRAVSAFLIWHMAALLIGAIPSPTLDPLPALPLPRKITDDRIAAVVAPPLDAVVERFATVPRVLWRDLRPVRYGVDLYLHALHLEQRWSMFANPPTVDQYLKIRYFVAPAGSGAQPTWMASELVLPAHREDSIRGVRSYFDSARDKAVAIAIDDFNRSFERVVDRTGQPPSPLPDDLAPVGRYFARRFERQQLRPSERIVRIETWYGEVRNPPRGQELTEETRAERARVLGRYYEGPIRATPNEVHRYGAMEHEADVTWKLAFFEDR